MRFCGDDARESLTWLAVVVPAVKSDIRVCAAWKREHDRPVYTLQGECPECGSTAVNSAPAPYNSEDPYGEYRRRVKRREREGWDDE